HAVMDSLQQTWEVIYVNDGSEDQSLNLLTRLHAAHPKTVVVADLSRNWGHQQAISAGLSLAKGDAVIVMDGDFQDPPSLIPEMVAAWKQGAEVVIARRTSRGERGLRRFLFPLFYRLLGYLSDYPIPLSAGVFGLMDRKVCKVLVNLQETNRFLPGLRSWVGFRTVFVNFDRPDRALGKPKQTLVHLVKYGFDAILSFSYKPLRMGLAFGLIMAAFACLAGVTLVVMRIYRLGIFRDNVVLGYTSLMCVVLLMGSIQLICTGILGEYIGRIYDEVKRRPLFVIRSVLERQP
ncbi:MAG TPA: glycosyltransferase family 2 protein, partial [Candidatus Acidoferrum sp.]|nr:glycosyltransferase family 2 protein [Candidatus Acidoferrum sp.]